MSDLIIIGVDHGYAAMKTAHFSFPTGLVEYEHEPYTQKDVLEYGGKYYVVGSARQPLQRDKTRTEDYYLLTLAAIAKELDYRGMERTAEVLLAAGLPVLNAMDIVSRVLDNRAMGRDLSLQLPRLEEGKPLAACLRDCPDFPDLLVEMTGVGEETGTLEHTLDVVSDYYDNETQLRAQKAVSLLEPAIICVLAVIVVVILLAVYLPMFSMYGSIM